MSPPAFPQSRLQSVSLAARPGDARKVYKALLAEPSAPSSSAASRAFLKDQLKQAVHLPCDFPLQPEAMTARVERHGRDVGEQYDSYLASRKAGKPRRYFSCRSHALAFIQRSAPTKLVDGAWLYGVLRHYADSRFQPLIRTYLEELGDGDPAHNHVVLYRQLLSQYECEPSSELSAEHYVQGALQLSLGYNAEQFMPELIGYNLGYEQLPLHLLITAFELNELSIDPYYFTLHITVDNASTGHARKAVQTVLNMRSEAADPENFMQRVANGYRLNELGLDTPSIIQAFDLEQELVDMLERKSMFGRQMHSDFCRIGGQTVNEWLTTPGQMRDFLQALQERGWIQRHTDPQQSRFWQLIDGARAQMFGVFSQFEQQLLYDWIAGDWSGKSTLMPASSAAGQALPRPKPFRRYRAASAGGDTTSASQPMARCIDGNMDDIKRELQQLPEELRMQQLIELMSPSNHASASGLLATRMFAAALH